MKILVTGSEGMLGSDLCSVLGREHDIAGIDIKENDVSEDKKETFYKADISDQDQVKKIFNAEDIDLVVHTAAWTDVDGCETDPEKAERINVLGTRNIVGGAGKKKIPVIAISTDYVFDGKKGIPYTEDDVCTPLSVYGRTKLEAEEAVKKGVDHFAIIRTSGLYGRYGKNFVDTIVKKSASGDKLKVIDDQVTAPTYTKDLAEAIERFVGVFHDNIQGIFHVSNSGNCSWYDLAVYIISEMGVTVDIESSSSVELDRPAKRPGFSIFDTGKFQAATGCMMRPWQDAVKEYLYERYDCA